jgi:hypothetical protein
VELFATNYAAGDLDQTCLDGITDELSATTASQVTGESFTESVAAPADSNALRVFRLRRRLEGKLALLSTGMAGLLAARRRRAA